MANKSHSTPMPSSTKPRRSLAYFFYPAGVVLAWILGANTPSGPMPNQFSTVSIETQSVEPKAIERPSLPVAQASKPIIRSTLSKLASLADSEWDSLQTDSKHWRHPASTTHTIRWEWDKLPPLDLIEFFGPGKDARLPIKAIVQAWAERTPEEASAWVASNLDHPHHQAAIVGMASGILREDPEAAAIWAARIDDDDERTDVLANATQAMFQTDPSRAEAMLNQAQLDEPQKTVIRESWQQIGAQPSSNSGFTTHDPFMYFHSTRNLAAKGLPSMSFRNLTNKSRKSYLQTGDSQFRLGR